MNFQPDYMVAPVPHDGLLRVNGMGANPAETMAQAAHILRCGYEWDGAPPFNRWDGSIVARMHTHEWAKVQLGMWHQARIVVLGGDRVVDMSAMIPIASLTYHLRADDTIPRGCARLETIGRVELGRVCF